MYVKGNFGIGRIKATDQRRERGEKKHCGRVTLCRDAMMSSIFYVNLKP